MVDGTGFDVTLPYCNKWFADTTFIQIALDAFKTATASKEVRVTAILMMGAVIAAEDDQRIVGDAHALYRFHNFTNKIIQTSHHGRKGRMRVRFKELA